ncbi:hypothetical protein OOT33_15315 [Sphingobium sp. DEHP117]|uniref:hypothetical protein n=1 Tax=Sphingobium sp. DEHP117 TaxID=2993436 RepID=UPI0027D702F8|nr:hypothetical protein [Sphingobium sp. DEHP117]MDQ4421794.1 hypothetical protein [Sphingobium sp. DEHP117]
MRQADENRESRSIREFGAFRQYWSQSVEYPDDNFGNNHVWMPISAIYSWPAVRMPLSFRSNLRAYVGSGPDDGQIDIDETTQVTIDDFHMRFHPRWQDYRFEESDHSLLISGSSGKMGGDYSVRVRPMIERPQDV